LPLANVCVSTFQIELDTDVKLH